jgi:hypothetical protein
MEKTSTQLEDEMEVGGEALIREIGVTIVGGFDVIM